MCGRFTLTSTQTELIDEFGGALASLEHEPRFNIAPTQDVAALAVEDDEPRAGPLRWGLIPHWAGDMSIGNRMINARAESVAEKPSFRAAFARRRCLILADGFYEWARHDGGKVPMWIHRADRRPFAFAGLWERWESEAGDVVGSCTIITTDANPFLRSIHRRMPVVLPREASEAWLRSDGEKDALLDLLRPYQGDDLEAHAVSTVVNSPRNDRPECIQAVV